MMTLSPGFSPPGLEGGLSLQGCLADSGWVQGEWASRAEESAVSAGERAQPVLEEARHRQREAGVGRDRDSGLLAPGSARDGVSREVPWSALKGETVPDSLPADDEESTCNARDLGSIPGLGRSPGEGNGYTLQYSSQRVKRTLPHDSILWFLSVPRPWWPQTAFH